MRISQTNDLTTGTPVRVLSIYAIPMLISMFFQQAYNLVDGWVAGNYIGKIALGAIGTCYPVTVFLIAISSGLSLGASIFCSQAYGAKKYADVKSAVSTSIIVYVPLAVVIGMIGAALSAQIVVWLDVPEEARQATIAYLRVYMAGFPFQFLYNLSNGVLTGLGNSKTPLIFLILSSVCNIALDYAFVAAMGFGVIGLALATILSQMLSAVLALGVVIKVGKQMQASALRFSKEIMKAVIKLGVPSMIQHMLMSLGQLSLQSVINGYGLVVMAGYSVAFRLNGLVINSLMALSNALSGFIAQNKGAGKEERIKQGIHASLFISYLFSACVVLILQIWGAELLGLFIRDAEDTSEVIAAGMGFVRVVSPFYLLVCLKIVFDGALRGVGAMTAFMVATMSDVVVRIFCGNPFSDRWGLNGVWAVWPTAWLVGTTLSVGMYCTRTALGGENEDLPGGRRATATQEEKTVIIERYRGQLNCL